MPISSNNEIISSLANSLVLTAPCELLDEDEFDLILDANIYARDIHALNIDARNIYAWNIDARNIYAWNIDALNIDAWNVSFYTFCISYRNIKCTSIKGRRENHIMKALDGEIIIKGESKC